MLSDLFMQNFFNMMLDKNNSQLGVGEIMGSSFSKSFDDIEGMLGDFGNEENDDWNKTLQTIMGPTQFGSMVQLLNPGGGQTAPTAQDPVQAAQAGQAASLGTSQANQGAKMSDFFKAILPMMFGVPTA